MNDETALTRSITLAELAEQAEQFTRATKLQVYQAKLSPETRRRQRRDLEAFAEFIESTHAEHGDFFNDLSAWSEVRASVLETFLLWQQREGYAIGTINVRLATLKAYCHVAYDAGYLNQDAYTHIQAVKQIRRAHGRQIDKQREVTRHPNSTKKADATYIPMEALTTLKKPATGYFAKRDALMMCLLLDHGLRVGELAMLTKQQINLAYVHPDGRRGLLTFSRPKVNKDDQRDVLTPDTYRAACAYWSEADEHLLHLSIPSIQKRVRELGQLVGLDKLSPHDCRHSWATRAASNKTPLDRLMQAGGWSNYQTPLRYIRQTEIANEGVQLGDAEEDE